jgi:hypothetical protein
MDGHGRDRRKVPIGDIALQQIVLLFDHLSGLASMTGGMVRPMASAVLRMMMKTNFVGN